MSSHTVFWIFGIAFGVWLAVHCPRAAIRELKSGIAVGRYGEYPRGNRPCYFWTTVVVTFLAGVMGVFFVAFGVAAIATGGDTFGEVLSAETNANSSGVQIK
jgi:hypothetical protein